MMLDGYSSLDNNTYVKTDLLEIVIDGMENVYNNQSTSVLENYIYCAILANGTIS